MIITKASINELERALRGINARYNNNIYLSSKSDKYNNEPCYKLSLLVNDTNKKGARLQIGKKSNLGCIHVHRDFFNILL